MFALSPPLMARNFEITIGSMWKQTRRRTVRLENWSQSLQFVATKPQWNQSSGHRKYWKLIRELESGGKISIVQTGRDFQRLKS